LHATVDIDPHGTRCDTERFGRLVGGAVEKSHLDHRAALMLRETCYGTERLAPQIHEFKMVHRDIARFIAPLICVDAQWRLASLVSAVETCRGSPAETTQPSTEGAVAPVRAAAAPGEQECLLHNVLSVGARATELGGIAVQAWQMR
jgi:hypothetical protein